MLYFISDCFTLLFLTVIITVASLQCIDYIVVNALYTA